jgi:hypothetical protein
LGSSRIRATRWREPIAESRFVLDLRARRPDDRKFGRRRNSPVEHDEQQDDAEVMSISITSPRLLRAPATRR